MELSIPIVAIGMIIYKNKLLIFRDWDPTVGSITNAIRRDEDSTATKVIGIYFMKPPTVPGQNNRGTKTAIVVRVEAIIGSDILEDAFR